MKMKAKIIKTGTINGRTYKANLSYHVSEQVVAAMQAQGMVKSAVPVVNVEKSEVKAPKQIVTKKVATKEPTMSKPTLTMEEAPAPKKPRAKKVTKEEKFEDGN